MKTLNEHFLEICQIKSRFVCIEERTPEGWKHCPYAEIKADALKIAGWLKDKSFKKQDKVALILDNSSFWGMVYFGVLLAGGVAVPLDPRSSVHDIDVFVKDSGADFIFVEKFLLASLHQEEFFVNKSVVCVEENSQGLICLKDILKEESLQNATDFPEIFLDDTASLIYTSGTTSIPKGVELSHRNLISNFESIVDLGIIRTEDVFISILPLFHVYSFMATFLLPFFLGCKIVYPKTLKSSELARIIRETKVTILVGVPELFYNIHKSIVTKIKKLPFIKRILLRLGSAFAQALRDCSRINLSKVVFRSVHNVFGEQLRYLISGGVRLNPKIADDFYTFGFTIFRGYGLTETSPLVTLEYSAKPKKGSVGKTVKDVSVKIVNPDEEGVGEVAIKGPNVMKGYYQKPEATALCSKDGWFYSGDLGFMDREGYLYLKGRSKEVIVLGSGKNIFPEEIEHYYSRSKFIKEVAVFLPSQEDDQKLKAIIVPNFESFKKTGDVNLEEKIQWDIENISKNLSTYKRIYGFVFSKDELPKTRLGKIKRYQLAKIYESKPSDTNVIHFSRKEQDEDKELLSSPFGKKVAGFLEKELFLTRSISAGDHLELDLGIDSLARVELVSAVETMFGIKISDEQTASVATVSDLIKLIQFKTDSSDIQDYIDTPKKISWNEILNEGSQEEKHDYVQINQEFFTRLISCLLKVFICLIFKIFFLLQIKGKENIPKKGPYIICCNHSSYLDAFAVIAALPFSVALQTYFIGTKDIFLHPSVRWTIRMARLIPIDSAAELMKAMKIASYVIRNKKVLAIFPEGQRSLNGNIISFKKGIGILAKELDMRILPVALWGTHTAWARAVKYPRPYPVKILFGKPVHYKEFLDKAGSSDDDYRTIAGGVQQEVKKLFDQIRSPQKPSIHKKSWNKI